MPLKMSERKVDAVSVLDLEGRIVLGEESSSLRERVKSLLDQDRNQIVLNMGQVSYIDSAGLGALVAAYTSAKNHGASLKLVNLGGKFREVLQVTKLLTVFDVYDTEQAAISSFPK